MVEGCGSPYIYVDGLSLMLGHSPPILSCAEQCCNFPILLGSPPGCLHARFCGTSLGVLWNVGLRRGPMSLTVYSRSSCVTWETVSNAGSLAANQNLWEGQVGNG